MTLYDNLLYMEDVKQLCSIDLPWERLRDKYILLSGATGLLGSFLIDTILEKNNIDKLNCCIYALSRNNERIYDRFCKYANDSHLIAIQHDIREPLRFEKTGTVDYVLHLASNTHPLQYATDPIGTITTNINGLQNMLEFAAEHNAKRFTFASSNEIYGENRGDSEFFDEDYCGYINSNTTRAGYPESKRCGEALCQAYKVQKDLDVVIPRFTRSYGPTMLMSDTKAISQFIKKGIEGEDVILKSAGRQLYSYTYVADAVSGLLTVMLKGENGGAYNISDEKSDITLKELAEIIANINEKKVIYEMPDNIEAAGYSVATKARLCGDKLKCLGWKPQYDIKTGVERTIKILKELGT